MSVLYITPLLFISKNEDSRLIEDKLKLLINFGLSYIA